MYKIVLIVFISLLLGSMWPIHPLVRRNVTVPCRSDYSGRMPCTVDKPNKKHNEGDFAKRCFRIPTFYQHLMLPVDKKKTLLNIRIAHDDVMMIICNVFNKDT